MDIILVYIIKAIDWINKYIPIKELYWRKFKKPSFEIKIKSNDIFSWNHSTGGTTKLYNYAKIIIYNKHKIPQTIEDINVKCEELKGFKVKNAAAKTPVTIEEDKPKTIELEVCFDKFIPDAELCEYYNLTFIFIDQNGQEYFKSKKYKVPGYEKHKGGN